MLRYCSKQNVSRLSNQTFRMRANYRQFSGIVEPPEERKIIPTPESGYRLPKERKNEEMIGHRVAGDTNIFSKP